MFHPPQGAEVVQDVAAGVVVSGLILAVRHLQRENSGHYTCAAANQEGHNTSNAVQLVVKRECDSVWVADAGNREGHIATQRRKRT